MEGPPANSQFLEEFETFLPTVAITSRHPLNTEMYFLWCMIRTTRPTLFIESGTYCGYSAAFICEALRCNQNGARFVTFGYDTEGCLQKTRQRLRGYEFAEVIEGDSRAHLASWPLEDRLTAFFVDGPKGRNMPPLFSTIEKRFRNKVFLAVHDCEPESGSMNRWYLETFWGSAYPIIYCDSGFQAGFSHLDEPLMKASEATHWSPYHLHGERRSSYGTQTGFVLFGLGRLGTPFSRSRARLYRFLRFRVVQQIAGRIRILRKRS